MKAWRMYAPHEVRLDEMEAQPVGEGCVKIKVLSSALSLTDTLIYNGDIEVPYPLILGRQGVGLVTEVGDAVTTLARGNRVVIDPYASCHACSACKAGKPYDCEKKLSFGYDEDGFMRDFAVVNADDVHALPDRVKDSDAVFLEHIAMAVNTVSKLDIEKGEHLVIVGASVIGIIMAQVAIYYQAVPILVDMRQDRLDTAAALGIYYTVNSVDTDPYKKIFSLTGGRMAEAVAYMSSAKMPLQRSIDYAGKGGRMAIVGWSNVGYELGANLSAVLNKQMTVTGISGSAKNLPTAINMLANKTVSVAPLISKEIPFDEVESCLAEQAQHPDKYVKVIVKI